MVKQLQSKDTFRQDSSKSMVPPAVSLAKRTWTCFFDNLKDSECGYLAALPLESHANDAHC